MSALDGITKGIAEKYKMDGIARVGVDNSRFKSTLSLGSPSLDFGTYNSIPEGIFIEIYGKESSGKTTLAFLIASDFIRKEKKKISDTRKKNEEILTNYEQAKAEALAKGKKAPAEPVVQDYKPRNILFVDAEGTADPIWAHTSTGYDMNDPVVETLYLTPLGQTAEQIMDMVIEAVKSGEFGLVIFDSLVAIAPQQVANESLEKKDMGTVAKVMADLVRRGTGLFNRFRTTFIGINGIYLDPSGYGNPEKTPGGEYWKRACSLRLKVQRGEYFDEDGKELTSKATSPAGHVIDVGIVKTKFCRHDRKQVKCHLNYRKGIDILQDTIDMATHFGMIEKSGGWYTFINQETGEYLNDENGKQIKLNGANNVKKYFNDHLDFWRQIYDEVYRKLSIKDDPTIMSFEQMLGINVEEKFGESFDGD